MNNFIRPCFIILCALAIVAAADYRAISALSGGVRIILPADKTSTEGTHLDLVMTVDPSRIDTVVYRVNDIRFPPIEVAKELPMKLKDGVVYLCKEIALDDGQNMLSVVGYAKGKVAAYEGIDVFSVLKSSLDKSTPPQTYRKPLFHTAEGEALCLSCHDNLKGSEKRITDLKGSPCYQCHKGVVTEKFVHGPTAVGDCTSCHNAKSKGKYSVPEKLEDICFRCHGEKKTDWKSKKYQHGPAATGDCAICHSPHASETKFFLKRDTNELCIGCHAEKATGRHVIASFVFGSSHPVSGAKNPLIPDREFSCASCHSPHASNSKEMFAFEAGGGKFSTCQTCHKK